MKTDKRMLSTDKKTDERIKTMIQNALAEDVGAGDITTKAIISAGAKAKGKIIAKQDGVICGLGVAKTVFQTVNPKIKFSALVSEGVKIKKGQTVARIQGPARGILTAERTALNFLQRMSGIATLTSKFTAKVKGLKVKILDTRKTAPGLRIFDKCAVCCGGGINHRMGLYDGVLIKDNHLALIKDLKSAAAKLKKSAPGVKIEVEAKNLKEVKEALSSGADIILLDNLDIKTLKEAVKLAKKKGVLTEASGGVNLDNVRAIAKTGVNFISIGALTHSAPALDISFEL